MQTTTITDARYDTVSLEEARRHLRIFVPDHDRELERVIQSAIQWCEIESGRTLRTAVERRTVMAGWDELSQSLPWQPVLAIEELTYIDQEGAEQTVDPDDYRLVSSTDAAAVLELDSEFDPPTVAARSDAIRVDYSTGYESIDLVPPLACQAVLTALKVYWGNLDAREVETWEACTRRILALVDWGCYR